MQILHLEILMHYYANHEPFSRDMGWIQTCVQELISLGLLESAGDSVSSFHYRTTEKCSVWLEMLVSTPLPVQKWVFEPK